MNFFKRKPVVVVEKVTLDDLYESDQMLTLASIYALGLVNKAQFRSLLQGATVELELKGGWEANLVESGYLVDNGTHILLERNADKKQKKEFAEDRILCTVSIPPEKIEDSKALDRYDLFFKYENLFKQIFSDDTSKKERKALIGEAMEIFYAVYKKFDTDTKKPANKQPQQRSDEPELKNFKANGYRTVAGMLGVPVEEILSMKAKERARFLEDMAIAAENFAIRSKYLTEKITMVAAQSTKDNDVWAALIWYFKDVDPQKVADLTEMQDGGSDVAFAARVCGGIDSGEELAEIVADYHAWKKAKKDGKGKGKGKGQKKQQTPPAGGTDPDSGSNKPYAGLDVEGFFAEIVVREGLANSDPAVVQEVLSEMKSRVPGFGNMAEACSVQDIYTCLLAYTVTNDITQDTTKSVMSLLVK